MAVRDSKLKNDALLEDFIKQYQATRGVGTQSYADYLRNYGKNAAKLYNDAYTAAHRTHDRSRAGYGIRGEELANLGGAGGYAAYLDRAARNTLARDTRQARETGDRAMTENLTGYSAYLENESDRLRRTVNNMREKGLVVYEDAYAYALTAGISPENADLAAKLIDGMEEEKLSPAETNARSALLQQMVDLYLPLDAAYNYAMASGLDSKSARDLAETAAYILANREIQRY